MSLVVNQCRSMHGDNCTTWERCQRTSPIDIKILTLIVCFYKNMSWLVIYSSHYLGQYHLITILVLGYFHLHVDPNEVLSLSLSILVQGTCCKPLLINKFTLFYHVSKLTFQNWFVWKKYCSNFNRFQNNIINSITTMGAKVYAFATNVLGLT